MSGEIVISSTVLLSVLAGLFFVILFFILSSPTETLVPKKISEVPKKVLTRSEIFGIYNYLEKPIRIVSLKKNGEVFTLFHKIFPRKASSLPMKDVEKHFLSGDNFKIYTLDSENVPTLYSEYHLNTPDGTMVKNLHVGMITTRWVGADGDYNIGKPGLNAVQGMPWVKIHNFTSRPLSLNNNINISPGGILRYTGRDSFGVRLGTIFHDQDRNFPKFIITVPATDIYYGVVSDIQQPIFGGFQLTHEFDEDPNEIQFPLELGYMGGPAQGNIPYGNLPIEGPNVPPQDRWGISKFNLKFPVGPPIEKNEI